MPWVQPSLFVLLVILSCLGLAAAWLWAARQRALLRRAAAERLLVALKSYSAWTDAQRGASLLGRSADELSLPEPLARAQALCDRCFPELRAPMVHLLLLHSRMMELLWREQLLELSGAGAEPVWRSPQYQQLRDRQEALVEDLIAHCRSTMGLRPWSATGSDFGLSGGLHGPVGGA